MLLVGRHELHRDGHWVTATRTRFGGGGAHARDVADADTEVLPALGDDQPTERFPSLDQVLRDWFEPADEPDPLWPDSDVEATAELPRIDDTSEIPAVDDGDDEFADEKSHAADVALNREAGGAPPSRFSAEFLHRVLDGLRRL